MAKKSMTAAEYEDIIRRMKLLSKCQTAFLKKYLNQKLLKAKESFQKAANEIPGNKQDLKIAIESISLDLSAKDLSFDETPFHNEIILLKKAIDGNVSTNSSNTSTLSSPTDQVELAKLKDQLALKEKELATAKDKVVLSENQIKKNETDIKVLNEKLSQRDTQSSSNDSEMTYLKSSVTKLEATNKDLKAQVEKKDQEIKVKDNDITHLKSLQNAADMNQTLQAEIDRLKKELTTKINEIETLTKEMNTKLTTKTTEFDTLQKKYDEFKKQVEKEKEEMVDVLAQEVEEVEKTKNKEIDELKKQKATLEIQVQNASQLNKTTTKSLIITNNMIQMMKAEIKQMSLKSKAEFQETNNGIRQMLSTSITTHFKASDAQMKQLALKYRKEMTERKKLHNIIQELRGNIRVYLRCRPPSSKEIEQFGQESSCITFPEPQKVMVFNADKNKEKVWEFDEVFGFDSTQEQIFNEVSGLVTSVLDGYNVCIFAYGQTGSGKTFTMSGPPDNRGVNTRALSELFNRSASRAGDIKDTISVNLLEVYNEDIRDLLTDNPNSNIKLEIRQSEYGNHVPGLTTVQVECLDDVLDLLQIADRNRSQASTNMNEHSSRSHMMLTVNILSNNNVTNSITRGKLNLVDLAGSERINKSGATGQALKEAQNINKSLSALGDVIAARVAKQNHIPFRNSTLTYLLQDCLSQDSKTLMIVCASPILQSAEETFCSLNFASRVRTVELGKANRQPTLNLARSSTGNLSQLEKSNLLASSGTRSRSNLNQGI